MVEPGEECDGDEFCTDGCKRLTPKQSACLVAAAAGASDVCRKCICLECTEPVNGCYLSEDAVRNANCKSIIDCGRNSNCTGVNCYCGDPSCSRANGPCTSVIEEAIGTRNPLQIAACFTDPDCVGGRSKQLSDCISFNCKEACADDFVTAAPAAM